MNFINKHKCATQAYKKYTRKTPNWKENKKYKKIKTARKMKAV